MPANKLEMKAIQGIVFEAYRASGSLLALLDGGVANLAAVADALDKVSGQFESGVVMLRNLCEKNHPGPSHKGVKPALPRIGISGRAEVNAYGWLHIELSALLPNCRYQTPQYLKDTVTRLLDECERLGQAIPRYDNAMLVIDEHCDIASRQIFDADNKGWKAIPNALKGRVVKDDDQFTLGLALISTRSDKTACHAYLFPREDTGDFFSLLGSDYPLFP